MKSIIKKLLAFLLAQVIPLTRRFPRMKSLVVKVSRKFPGLTVRLRRIVDGRSLMEMTRAVNEIQPSDLTERAANIYKDFMDDLCG